MQADSFTRALEDLDPISRALVELSIRQGLDDEEIAGMLGRETADVTEQREAALRELAREIAPHAKSAPLPELESAIAAAIGTGEPADETSEPEPEPEPQPAFDGDDRRETDKLGAYVLPPHLADDREATRPHLHVVQEAEQPSWLTEPRYEAAPRRKKSDTRLKILVPLLLVVLIVAVVVGLQRSGDGDSSDTANTPAATTAAQTDTPPPADDKPAPADDEAKDAEPAKPEPQSLAPLAGAPDGVKGTASITDGTLTLKVSGLPEGTYGVWLFNSLIDSQQLGTETGTKISLKKKLPSDADAYQYVDVSVEPADGNPNHSGESVLRVPLDTLEK